jgi:membrane peptidoglycan carboxypeptidase
VLDPRVVFLMDNLLEEVLNSGTGAGVRGRGINFAAAGKTGTSHDGWFAGYTTDLICIVWVGYDTDRELNLTGAESALPIWTEFMKRAIQVPEYSRTLHPSVPPGIVQVEIDPQTGLLASPRCGTAQNEYFLEGTEPSQFCDQRGLPAGRPALLPRRLPMLLPERGRARGDLIPRRVATLRWFPRLPAKPLPHRSPREKARFLRSYPRRPWRRRQQLER